MWAIDGKGNITIIFPFVSLTTIKPLHTDVRLLPDIEELWIGLHDTDMQMDFQWTDHTPVIFTYWHPFEPNNFRNTQEDCVTIWGPVSTPLNPPSPDPDRLTSCRAVAQPGIY